MEIWIKNKKTNEEVYEHIGDKRIATIQWRESNSKEWGGVAPIIVIEYDTQNGFLLQLTIHYKRRQAAKNLAFTPDELATRLMKELEQAKVFIPKKNEENTM